MAAKGSKPDYTKIASYFTDIPEGSTTINIERLNKLFTDEKRVEALNWDAFFNESLKRLLTLHFVQQDKDVEMLMQNINMAKKARIAYALGLIDRTALNDFVRIHNIRNEFAHRFDATFADTAIRRECMRLSTAKDQKTVTAKNPYKSYISALRACRTNIQEAFKQEQYRQAALMMAREESKTENHPSKKAEKENE